MMAPAMTQPATATNASGMTSAALSGEPTVAEQATITRMDAAKPSKAPRASRAGGPHLSG